MHEIDLLLLEDAMMRRNFDTTARARALQTGCMLLMLAALAIVFMHALTRRDTVAAVETLQTETAVGNIAGYSDVRMP